MCYTVALKVFCFIKMYLCVLSLSHYSAQWFVAIICYPGLYDPNAPAVHVPQATVSSTTKRVKKRKKIIVLKRRLHENEIIESPEKKENSDNSVPDDVLEEELEDKSKKSRLVVEQEEENAMESTENTVVGQEEEVEVCAQGEDSGLSAVVVDCTDKEKSDDCEGLKEEEGVMEVEREEKEVVEEREFSSAVEMVAANTDVDPDSTTAFSTPTVSTVNDSSILLRSEGAKPAPQPNRYYNV